MRGSGKHGPRFQLHYGLRHAATSRIADSATRRAAGPRNEPVRRALHQTHGPRHTSRRRAFRPAAAGPLRGSYMDRAASPTTTDHATRRPAGPRFTPGHRAVQRIILTGPRCAPCRWAALRIGLLGHGHGAATRRSPFWITREGPSSGGH